MPYLMYCFMLPQTSSIGFKSFDSGGHSSVSIRFLCSHFFVYAPLWAGALSWTTLENPVMAVVIKEMKKV